MLGEPESHYIKKKVKIRVLPNVAVTRSNSEDTGGCKDAHTHQNDDRDIEPPIPRGC